jgi:hypothetical protein
MTSIHDSLLTGYVVDGKARSLVLHTEPHAGGGEAIVDVVFLGVVAYHLEGDCLKNIVFGVEEVSPEDVIGDGAAFAERQRLYGWPGNWNPNTETLAQFLSRPGVKVFELQCSYGMGGWVAAESMEQRVVSAPA